MFTDRTAKLVALAAAVIVVGGGLVIASQAGHHKGSPVEQGASTTVSAPNGDPVAQAQAACTGIENYFYTWNLRYAVDQTIPGLPVTTSTTDPVSSANDAQWLVDIRVLAAAAAGSDSKYTNLVDAVDNLPASTPLTAETRTAFGVATSACSADGLT